MPWRLAGGKSSRAKKAQDAKPNGGLHDDIRVLALELLPLLVREGGLGEGHVHVEGLTSGGSKGEQEGGQCLRLLGASKQYGEGGNASASELAKRDQHCTSTRRYPGRPGPILFARLIGGQRAFPPTALLAAVPADVQGVAPPGVRRPEPPGHCGQRRDRGREGEGRARA